MSINKIRSFWHRSPLFKLRRKLFERSCEQIIERTLRGRDVRFLQVGSNDGKHGDPIFELARRNWAWSGILVEPVPPIFARLKENYGDDPRFTFECVAISTEKGERTFYTVSKEAKEAYPDLPEWYDQLNSFDRAHIVKHLDGKLEPFIVELKIECQTLETVLARNAVTTLDLVHIDTEGYDWQVLSQVDLDALKPTIVVFEHAHLSRDDRVLAENKLTASGYRITYRGNDTLAIKDRALSRA